MTTTTYAKLDGTHRYNQSNVLLANSNINGLTYSDGPGVIAHTDIAVEAGVSFSYEATFANNGGFTMTGLTAGNNSGYPNKEVLIQGGSIGISLAGVSVPGTAQFTATTIMHLDFDASTARVVIYAGNTQVLDQVIPSLLNKPIYVFAGCNSGDGVIQLNFGQSTFNRPRLNTSMRFGVMNVSSATVSGNHFGKPVFETVYGPYYRNNEFGTYGVNTFGYRSQKFYYVQDTLYKFNKQLQGMGRSGGIGAAYANEKVSIGRESQSFHLPTPIRTNLKMAQNGYEQNRQEAHTPRLFWGDH